MPTTAPAPADHSIARPRSRRRGILSLALLGTVSAGWFATPAMAQVDTRPTIAVMYFTNGALSADIDYAPLSKGMAELMITELLRNPGIRLLERDRLQEILEEQNLSTSGRVDKATAVRVGQIVGASHVLMGAFVVTPKGEMRIDVRAVNSETTEYDYAETVSGKADNLMSLVSELGAKVNAGLKLPSRPADATKFSDAGGKNPNQFKAMLLLSRAIEEQDKKNVSGAVALYKQAIDAKPEFERAKVRLASLERGTPER